MLYDVFLCDVLLCDALFCDVLLCDVLLCDILFCDVLLCDVLLRDVYAYNWFARNSENCCPSSFYISNNIYNNFKKSSTSDTLSTIIRSNSAPPEFLHRGSFKGILIDEVGLGDVKDLVKDVDDVDNIWYVDKNFVGNTGNGWEIIIYLL